MRTQKSPRTMTEDSGMTTTEKEAQNGIGVLALPARHFAFAKAANLYPT